MDAQALTSRRPYLLRAMYDWLQDNALTPYIAVDAAYPGAMVPQTHVTDGHIILNISAAATHNLVLGNERVEFSAAFGGQQRFISLPIGAVIGIYAQEGIQGMMFPEREEALPPASDEVSGGPGSAVLAKEAKPRPTHLSLVKKDQEPSA